jgi:N-acetylglucosaminyl-diphospho-decaprenol L-rhamnosyltransferase
MSTDSHEISVVIPSWNTRDYLRACLESLRATPKPSTELIVVDNGSADGSADLVAELEPDATLIRNEKNEGFARGSNQGMRVATGKYVLLLNTDTEFRADALQRMHAFLEENPTYAAVAPRLIHPDGRTQRTIQEFPNLRTTLFFSTPLERWFPNSRELRRYFIRDWDQESSRDVDQPPAACLLIRKQVLDQVGLFDEELWLFYNDVDLARRLKAAGWKTRYLAEAEVVHHVGASTSKFAGFVPEWQKNRLAFYRKHHGFGAGAWIKFCTSLTFFDWIWTQRWARLRGKPAEDTRAMWKIYWGFVRS